MSKQTSSAAARILKAKAPQNYPQALRMRRNVRFCLRAANGLLFLLSDHSGLALPDTRGRQGWVAMDAEAATGTASPVDLILVPSDGSNARNVTGGRKLARHDSCVPVSRARR